MKKNVCFALILIVSNISILCAEARRDIAPEFSNLQWRNTETEISEAHVFDTVLVSFQTKNIYSGEIVKIAIWEYSDEEITDLISELEGVVQDEQVLCTYKVHYDEASTNTHYAQEIADQGYTILDYVFIVTYRHYTSMRSKELAINDWIESQVIDHTTQKPSTNTTYKILTSDKDVMEGKTDSDGWIKIRNLRKVGRTYRLYL
jgi:hypothetical protein